jgi:two-component system chemotaxis sensor kinase CheA
MIKLENSMKQKFFDDTSLQLNILLNTVVILEDQAGNTSLVDNLMRIAHSLKGSSRVMEFRLLESLFHTLEDRLLKYRDKGGEALSPLVDDMLSLGRQIQFCLTMLRAGFGEDEVEQRLNESSAFDSIDMSVPGEVRQEDSSIVQVGISRLDELTNLMSEILIKENSLQHHLSELERLGVRLSQKSYEFFGELKNRLSVDDNGKKDLDPVSVLLAYDELHRTEEEKIKKHIRGLKVLSHHIDSLLEEAKHDVLLTRLAPVSEAFDMIPRFVRELSGTQGKKVKLTVDGGETLLDKYILDGISKALLHLIRNAVDHGIETPVERKALGKGEAGRLLISATSQGNRVIIRVEDDGRGIDEARLKEKVLERGLVSSDEISGLSSQDLYKFLFRHGISTSEKVSEISGRGVGMDVVRESLERLKGSIRINSTAGMGTFVELQVPLTLSIMQAYSVRSRDEYYFIPSFNVDRIADVPLEDVRREREVFVWEKGDELPIANLVKVLYRDTAGRNETGGNDTLKVVILRSLEKRWGIVVDEVFPKKEVVVKSLGAFLRKVRHFQGATVTGDGRVFLILDVPSLFKALEILGGSHHVKKQV